MATMKKALLVLSGIVFFTVSASAVEIRLCYEDVTVFPWITGDNKGVVINQLHLVEKKLNMKFTMVRLPWKRCQLEARKGNFEGIIAASYNDDRAEWGIYPSREFRLHTDSFYIYTRKDSPILWKDGKLHNLEKNEVGVQLGYSVGTYIQKLGYPLHSNFTTALDVVKELDRGIINVAVLQDHETIRVLTAFPEYKEKIVRQQPPFKVADQYLLFTKKFYGQNEKLSKKIWRAISIIRESAEYKKMVENELKQI